MRISNVKSYRGQLKPVEMNTTIFYVRLPRIIVKVGANESFSWDADDILFARVRLVSAELRLYGVLPFSLHDLFDSCLAETVPSSA